MMKKLFLFVAALTLSLTSCSSDDDKGGNGGGGGNSELKVTIDGVQKIFNTIDVNVYDQEDGYGNRTITASIDNNPSEIIVFSIVKGDTGSDALYNFKYEKNGTEYRPNNGGFLTSIAQTNSNGRLKGTFIGKLIYRDYDYENWEEVIEEIELTNGSFDISY